MKVVLAEWYEFESPADLKGVFGIFIDEQCFMQWIAKKYNIVDRYVGQGEKYGQYNIKIECIDGSIMDILLRLADFNVIGHDIC